MYDHIWIPKSIEEQKEIVFSNPDVFSDYFQKTTKEGTCCVFYYYKYIGNNKYNIVSGHDWLSSIFNDEDYLPSIVRDTTNTSLATLVKHHRVIKHRQVIKY